MSNSLNVRDGKEIQQNSAESYEVRPLYKNDGRPDKRNHRPTSILFNVSKIYERWLYTPLYDYSDNNVVSKHQCSFCKGFSIQHTLPVMIEKIKISSDNKKICSAIFTNLSKVFDCIYRDLLIAKLSAYGIDRNALNFIYNYVSDRSQKTKVAFSFSTY